jgi:hypothetical protein
MKRNASKYPVEMMSYSFGVSRSGNYKWLKKSHVYGVFPDFEHDAVHPNNAVDGFQ